MTTNLGTFNYGSNPVFTVTFQQSGINADPSNPVVKITDPNGNHSQPSLLHSSTGAWQFTIPGGLNVANTWTGRAFSPGPTGEASVDFYFTVSPTANP